MICPKICPMLNQYGYCRDAMRPPERIRMCPHQAVHRAVCKPPSVRTERGRVDGN